MFDLFFDSLMAWNQIGFMLMALVFIAIGGGMIAYELSWRVRGSRVKGKVKEIRVTGVRSKRKVQEYEEPGDDSRLIAEEETEEKSLSGTLVTVLVFTAIFGTFAAIGGYFVYKNINLMYSGTYAQGEVIRNDSSYDSDSGTSYKAVIAFTDIRGVRHEVKDNVSYGSSPSYDVGTALGVYYDPQDPQHFVIDDPWHTMPLPAVFLAVGVGLPLLIAWFSFRPTQPRPAGKERRNTKSKKSAKAFTGETYYNVFEYHAPGGERMEKVSSIGATGLFSKLPGDVVTLLILPKDPEKVHRPNFILPTFGLVFLLPGLWVGKIALGMGVNYMTFVILFAIMAYFGFKIWGFVQKNWTTEMGDDLRSGWKHMKTHGIEIKSSDNSGVSTARALSAAELKDRLYYYARQALMGGYVLAFVAVGLAGGAYYAGLDMVERMNSDVQGAGVVIGVESRSDSDGTVYYAKIRFLDGRGVRHVFRDSVGASTPVYQKGDDVVVLYNPATPRKAIIDRGIWNWSLSIGLALGACLILWLSLKNLSYARRFGSPKMRGRI